VNAIADIFRAAGAVPEMAADAQSRSLITGLERQIGRSAARYRESFASSSR